MFIIAVIAVFCVINIAFTCLMVLLTQQTQRLWNVAHILFSAAVTFLLVYYNII